jgi:hypothetical protein
MAEQFPTAGESTSQEEVELLEEADSRLERLIKIGEDALTKADAILSELQGVSTTLQTFLADFIASITPPSNPAVRGVLTQGDSTMALNVDSTTGDIVLSFEDDKNDPTQPPAGDGSGLVVTPSSDNTAVLNLGAPVPAQDANGNGVYNIPVVQPLTEGSANVSAQVANQSGAPLMDADGVTPFVQPTAINVPVSAGQAAQGSLAEVGG